MDHVTDFANGIPTGSGQGLVAQSVESGSGRNEKTDVPNRCGHYPFKQLRRRICEYVAVLTQNGSVRT
jgi:hypothetical protein